MKTAADETIDALRSGHRELAALANRATPDAVTLPSGCRQWDVSQVFGHLGSGAEIGLASIDAALAGNAAPDPGGNVAVWSRWDAMGPGERAERFIRADEALVSRYESLDPPTRRDLRIDLGFLPAPVDVATAGALRLNEVTLHAWDVKVVFDEDATLAPDAVDILVDRVGLLIGFLGRTGPLAGREAALGVTTTDPARTFGLELREAVALVGSPKHPDGVLRAPAEAWLRLVTGRLSPEHTPRTVSLAGGPVDLDDLRRVFPGF